MFLYLGSYLFISVYFWLFWCTLVYLGLSLSISVYLGLSGSIWVYLGQSRTISDYQGLSEIIWDYLGLSGIIWNYLRLSRSILDYLRLSWTRVQVEAGESKLLLFEIFGSLRLFTYRIYHASKKVLVVLLLTREREISLRVCLLGVYPKKKLLVILLPSRQINIFFRVHYFCRLYKRTKTSWGWAVPSSEQLKLATTSSKLSYPIARSAYSANYGWSCKLGWAVTKNLLALRDEMDLLATTSWELAIH